MIQQVGWEISGTEIGSKCTTKWDAGHRLGTHFSFIREQISGYEDRDCWLHNVTCYVISQV